MPRPALSSWLGNHYSFFVSCQNKNRPTDGFILCLPNEYAKRNKRANKPVCKVYGMVCVLNERKHKKWSLPWRASDVTAIAVAMIAADAASDEMCSFATREALFTFRKAEHIVEKSTCFRKCFFLWLTNKIAQRQKGYKIKILDAISICSRMLVFTTTK